MSGHAAFLEEILAHPEDDVPRLVYADWLDEQGDPRGEFIRVQCLMAKLPFEDDRRWSLQTRERLLRQQFGKEWASGIREHAIHWQFHRGFIERITIPAETFLERAPELFQAAPIRGLKLLKPESQLSALAASPWLERLESLDLSYTDLDWFDFEDLAWSPSLIHLKELKLQGTPLCNDPGLRILAECEFLHNLQALDLGHTSGDSIEPSTIEELSNSPYFKKLTSLKIAGHGEVGGRMFAALADSPWLEQLTHLELSQNIGAVLTSRRRQSLDRGLARLFQSPHAANLEHLRLIRIPVTQSLSSFAESPYFRRLKSLAIWGAKWDRLPARLKKELWSSRNFKNLISLDLTGCQIDDRLYRGLFESEAFENLKELRLDEMNPGDDVVQTLAASPILGQLRALRMLTLETGSSRRLTAEGFRAFAQTPASQLEVLDLANQPVSDLSPLTESAISQNLRELGLSNTQIGDSAVEILCDPDAFPNLELLDLHSVDLNDESKNRLQEHFGAGVEIGPDSTGKRESGDR